MATVAWRKPARMNGEAAPPQQPQSQIMLGKHSLKDIMSEQVIEKITHSPETAPLVPPRTDEDADLLLALELSAKEAEAAGIPVESNTANALDPDTTGGNDGVHDESTDLALALALAEEEARYQLTQSSNNTKSHVAFVSQSEILARDALLRRRQPERKLYSADDAVSGEAGCMDQLVPGGLPIPSAHVSHHDYADIIDETAEGDDQQLYNALRGRGMVGEDGEMLTKHDMQLAGRRTARQLERSLGAAAGDLSSYSINPSAVVHLKRYIQKQTVKGTASRGRVEEAHYATHDSVIDERSSDILMKLINSGRLAGVGGVCKIGKEAAVLVGLGWDAAVHADLIEEGWHGQRAVDWEEQDKGEEEDESDGEEVEGEATGVSVAVTGSEGAPSHVADAVRLGGEDVEDEEASEVASTAHGGDTDVAVKIFKMSLSDFKDRREYMEGDRRYSRTKLKHQNPRKIVTLWAEKEFKNLVRVHRAGIPSPAPLLLRGHVIVMEFIGREGWPAPQLKEAPITSAREWARVYRQVVAIMNALYKWTHLVHADLSEYNLLYWEKRVIALDFGQAVDTSHPQSDEFLRKDCHNITRFFERKGVITLPETALYDLIKNGKVGLRPAYGRRTGAHDGHVPAVGSGLSTAERFELETRIATNATEGIVHPVESAIASRSVDEDAADGSHFDGDFFDGEENPVARHVDDLLEKYAASQ